MDVVDILKKALETVAERGKSRDTEVERSMGKTVERFNAHYGTNLTEEMGWHFMQMLKDTRHSQGDFNPDDLFDGFVYGAFRLEAAYRAKAKAEPEIKPLGRATQKDVFTVPLIGPTCPVCRKSGWACNCLLYAT